MRSWWRACVALGVALVVAGGMFGLGHAATPSSGTLDGAHRRLTWTGGPLVGSAPAERRITCKNPLSCDEFTLNVNLPPRLFGLGLVPTMTLTITPSGSDQIQILVYQPGSDPSDPNNSDYTVFPTQATYSNPTSGTWHIFASCYTCTGNTYTMTAVATGQKPLAALRAVGFTTHEFSQAGGGEPGVEYGPDGSIWVNANTGGPGQFWGSYDNGKTWTFVQPDTTFGGGDTWLTVGAGGEIYTDELQAAPPTDFVFVSKDHGKTWTNLNLAGINIPYAAGVDADREWFTADPKIAGTVYFERHDLADPGIQVYKSTDYGQTWLLIDLVNIDDVAGGGTDTLGGCTTGPIRFAPDGTMAFPLGCSTAVEGTEANADVTSQDFIITKMYVATSTTKGASWALHLVVDRDGIARIDHGRYPVVWDRSGNLYVAYSERLLSGTATDMYVTASKDKGATWTKPLKISDNGGSNIFPAIAAGGLTGNVDVAWLESPAKDFDDPNADWRVVMSQSFNMFDAHPLFTKSQISPGLIHHGDVCQAGTLCLVTMGNRSLLDYIWMDVDHNGIPHVVYTNDISGTVKIDYTSQIGGLTTLQKPTTVLAKHEPASTRGSTVSGAPHTLPATGIATGASGLLLLGLGGALGVRLRLARR